MLVAQIEMSEIEAMPIDLREVLIRLVGKTELNINDEPIEAIKFISVGVPEPIYLWEVSLPDILKHLPDDDTEPLQYMADKGFLDSSGEPIVDAIQLVDIGFSPEIATNEEVEAQIDKGIQDALDDAFADIETAYGI